MKVTGTELNQEQRQEHRKRLNEDFTFEKRSKKIQKIFERPDQTEQVLNVAQVTVQTPRFKAKIESQNDEIELKVIKKEEQKAEVESQKSEENSHHTPPESL